VRYLSPVPIVFLIFSTCAAGRLGAQHVAAEQSGDVIAEAQSCALCHGTHGGGGDKGLKLGPNASSLTGSQSLIMGSSSELSDASRACLRCHETPEERGRQPEFGGRQLSSLQARGFLGPDMSDDHPVGSRDFDPAMLPSTSLSGAFRPDDDPMGQQLALVGLAGDLRVECTTCHDPHSREPMRLSAEEEQVLCSGCHDPGVYVSMMHSTIGCSACHGIHGSGASRRLLRAPDADLLCTSCHVAGVAPQSDAGSVAQIDTGPIAHLSDPRAGECSTCHDVH